MSNTNTVEIPRTTVPTVPIYQVKNLSTHAKVVWSAWQIGLPLTEEAWEDYLAKMRVPYVPLDACKAELRRNGWIA
ncbi:hypothetical protein [Streptomyces sp. NBC_00588]|uniref:hypothetical protein n=1 Tax=Streptomyces sp. NBC_00588 TaxID=2975784 RepID=UPI002E818DB8|nr:hypothetical protein [Streptomyces sp. NBC_00588]WUB35370.1 hypothetical protein OHN38_10780 [Streptomyces sp. NBC_00588]